MQFWVRVHVIKKLLVIGILLVPLLGFIIAEIVSQRYQQNFATEKLRLLAILVQKGLNPDIQKETSVLFQLTAMRTESNIKWTMI